MKEVRPPPPPPLHCHLRWRHRSQHDLMAPQPLLFRRHHPPPPPSSAFPSTMDSHSDSDPITESDEEIIPSDKERELKQALVGIPFKELQRAPIDGSHFGCLKPLCQQKLARTNKNMPMVMNNKARVGRYREAAKQGKQPYYLKQSEIRKRELSKKFSELKAAGKLESFMEKKEKKNASKGHRYMPY